MEKCKVLFTVENTWDLGPRGLSSAETETAQHNIIHWLQLDEGDPGFNLLTEEEIAAVVFLVFIFISTTYIIKLLCFLSFFFL
jgi:hypothetical protein